MNRSWESVAADPLLCVMIRLHLRRVWLPPQLPGQAVPQSGEYYEDN